MSNDELEVTVSRIYKFDMDQPLKAFVDVTINNAILIKGIRIVDGREGLFVSMPREQSKDKRWFDSVKCLNNQIKKQISEEVLLAYQSESVLQQ